MLLDALFRPQAGAFHEMAHQVLTRRRTDKPEMLAMFVRRCLLPPLCLFVAALLPAQVEASQKLTFQWDPSPEPDVVAYRLYIGQGSHLYTQTLQVSVPTTSA